MSPVSGERIVHRMRMHAGTPGTSDESGGRERGVCDIVPLGAQRRLTEQ